MAIMKIVDADRACKELMSLCDALELYMRGTYPQGLESAKRSAFCLFAMLGDDPNVIVSVSGDHLTTAYLQQVFHVIPWQIEIMYGNVSPSDAWALPSIADVVRIRAACDVIATPAVNAEYTEERRAGDWRVIFASQNDGEELSRQTWSNRIKGLKGKKIRTMKGSRAGWYQVHIDDLPDGSKSKPQRQRLVDKG